jgi:hypothetical protein
MCGILSTCVYLGGDLIIETSAKRWEEEGLSVAKPSPQLYSTTTGEWELGRTQQTKESQNIPTL